MKKTTLYFIILTLIFSCKPKQEIVKNISCNTETIVQFDRQNYNRNTNPKIPKDSKIFTVIFLSEFKDSIQGYVNGKLFYKDFVNQRDSDDSNSHKFGKTYLKTDESPIIKIESLTRNSCFDFKIDKRYSFIYVWVFENGKWQIRYSNSYYIN